VTATEHIVTRTKAIVKVTWLDPETHICPRKSVRVRHDFYLEKVLMNKFPLRRKGFTSSRAGLLTATVAVAAAATAVWVKVRALEAERESRPAGEFIHINGVRLHYVMRGHGPL
jgi:hypothetical protein